MVSSKSLSIDVVIHILSYCKDVVIRNRNIIFIGKLDKNKYARAINLLLKKKLPIQYIFDNFNSSITSVYLDKNIEISYMIHMIPRHTHLVFYNYNINNKYIQIEIF